MTDHLTINPHKYSFFFIEFSSIIIGILIGALVTVFLLFPKDGFPPSFYRPYESIGIVDTAKLLDEYRKFLDFLAKENALSSENLAMLIFFERFEEAIDHIKTQKKITLFDAQKMIQLPDYTDDVRKYLSLPENPKDSHKKTTIQKEEDHP